MNEWLHRDMSENEMILNYYPASTQISAHTNKPISFGEDSIKKLPVFWCDTCSLKLATPTQAIQHFSGKSHLAAVAASKSDVGNKRDLDSNSNLVPDGPDSKKIKLDQSIECKECGIMLNSSSMAVQHFKGKKHALIIKKLEAASEKLSNPLKKSNSKSTFCQCCSITLNSEDQIKQHFNGMRHKVNVGLEQPSNDNQRTGKAARGRGNCENLRGGKGKNLRNNQVKVTGKLVGNNFSQKRGNGRGIGLDVPPVNGRINRSDIKVTSNNRGRRLANIGNTMGRQKSKYLNMNKGKHSNRGRFRGNIQANKHNENPYSNEYSEADFQMNDHLFFQDKNVPSKNYFDFHFEKNTNLNRNNCRNPSEQTVPNNMYSSNIHSETDNGRFMHNHTYNSKNYGDTYDDHFDNNYGDGNDDGNYYSYDYQRNNYSNVNDYYSINEKKKLEPKSDFQINSDAMYDAYYA